MKGLELAEQYYLTYGRPMLEEQFPHLMPLVAVGLAGSGSECLGYDDDISRDHDFEPGFGIYLPGEDQVSRRDAFLLERAYARLPREFMGIRRSPLSPVGGARHGIIRIADFFTEKVGAADGVLTIRQWLTVPEQALLEATNGKVFYDGPGAMSLIRASLKRYPEDIMKKRLAGHLLLMAQSGQYNYRRCLAHGEKSAAQLAAIAFTDSAIQVIFLLNRVYRPYYKWVFRALRTLPRLSLEAEALEYLITTDNDSPNDSEKYDVIESVAADVIDVLRTEGLSKAVCGDLEKHAYSVNDSVADPVLRNQNVLAAVREEST